nr:uncharacterized protein LOC105879057 isoform X2 [Microcebus murinus]
MTQILGKYMSPAKGSESGDLDCTRHPTATSGFSTRHRHRWAPARSAQPLRPSRCLRVTRELRGSGCRNQPAGATCPITSLSPPPTCGIGNATPRPTGRNRRPPSGPWRLPSRLTARVEGCRRLPLALCSPRAASHGGWTREWLQGRGRAARCGAVATSRPRFRAPGGQRPWSLREALLQGVQEGAKKPPNVSKVALITRKPGEPPCDVYERPCEASA